jgi:hypothetical protein
MAGQPVAPRQLVNCEQQFAEAHASMVAGRGRICSTVATAKQLGPSGAASPLLLPLLLPLELPLLLPLELPLLLPLLLPLELLVWSGPASETVVPFELLEQPWPANAATTEVIPKASNKDPRFIGVSLRAGL